MGVTTEIKMLSGSVSEVSRQLIGEESHGRLQSTLGRSERSRKTYTAQRITDIPRIKLFLKPGDRKSVV